MKTNLEHNIKQTRISLFSGRHYIKAQEHDLEAIQMFPLVGFRGSCGQIYEVNMKRSFGCNGL